MIACSKDQALSTTLTFSLHTTSRRCVLCLVWSFDSEEGRADVNFLHLLFADVHLFTLCVSTLLSFTGARPRDSFVASVAAAG